MSFEYFVFSNVYIHYLVVCTHRGSRRSFCIVHIERHFIWTAISEQNSSGYQEILPTIKHITGIQEEYILVKYVDFINISVFH